MPAAVFEHGLSPMFIDALQREADRDGWWRDVLSDPKLVIATRGRTLNVYWQGQALFNVALANGQLRVTTHEKFLTDPTLAGQVPLLADGTFDTVVLSKRGLIDRYAGTETLKKMKTTAALFAGDEKRGCHEIAVRNASVIDVEVAFPGRHRINDKVRTAPRVDLAAVEPHGSDVRLVFWEAKTYANGELRAVDDIVPVCNQIAVYQAMLAEQRVTIEASMTRVAENLVAFRQMGWKRQLSDAIRSVGEGKAKLRMGDEPRVGLIVFGFDAGQRDEKRWQAHKTKLEAKIAAVRFVGDPAKVKI